MILFVLVTVSGFSCLVNYVFYLVVFKIPSVFFSAIVFPLTYFVVLIQEITADILIPLQDSELSELKISIE